MFFFVPGANVTLLKLGVFECVRLCVGVCTSCVFLLLSATKISGCQSSEHRITHVLEVGTLVSIFQL